MSKSIDIIHDEHRALAAMLQALRALVRGIDGGKMQPDFHLLASMIEYIYKVPERVHHPKESQFLFTKLRLRHPAAAGVLDALEEDHRTESQRIGVLEAALNAYRKNGATAFPAFKDAANQYIDDEWRHMGMEEIEVFPMVKKYLTAEDWAEIDGAFCANDNPWSGAAGEYAALFSKIVNLAPPPIGVGPG